MSHGAGLFIVDRTIFAPAAVTDRRAGRADHRRANQGAGDNRPSRRRRPEPRSHRQPRPLRPPADRAVVYRIDPAQSEAHYEVGETFFQGNRFNLAIGRTKGVAGEVLVDFANPANSQIGTIVIDVSQLTSDEGRRDNFIRNNALQSSKYPQATFKPTKIEGLPASVKPGDQLTLKVTGDLTVKETTKPVTFDVTLTGRSR